MYIENGASPETTFLKIEERLIIFIITSKVTPV